MCGITGSGKSTYALQLVEQGYVRLSVDEYIWSRYGVFGVDYDEMAWLGYQAEAEARVLSELDRLLAEGARVVLDLSFWSRTMRDAWRSRIEARGGTWELLYMRADPAVIRARLIARRARNDANAFPIPDEMLERFIVGFEPPQGEGETVIEQA
jgi:predicted kinase